MLIAKSLKSFVGWLAIGVQQLFLYIKRVHMLLLKSAFYKVLTHDIVSSVCS